MVLATVVGLGRPSVETFGNACPALASLGHHLLSRSCQSYKGNASAFGYSSGKCEARGLVSGYKVAQPMEPEGCHDQGHLDLEAKRSAGWDRETSLWRINASEVQGRTNDQTPIHLI